MRARTGQTRAVVAAPPAAHRAPSASLSATPAPRPRWLWVPAAAQQKAEAASSSSASGSAAPLARPLLRCARIAAGVEWPAARLVSGIKCLFAAAGGARTQAAGYGRGEPRLALGGVARAGARASGARSATHQVYELYSMPWKWRKSGAWRSTGGPDHMQLGGAVKLCQMPFCPCSRPSTPAASRPQGGCYNEPVHTKNVNGTRQRRGVGMPCKQHAPAVFKPCF